MFLALRRRWHAYRWRRYGGLQLWALAQHDLTPGEWESPAAFYERVMFFEDLQLAVHRVETRQRAARQ